MQYTPELVPVDNISEGVINNPILYTIIDGLISGIGQIKLTPNTSGIAKVKFLTPVHFPDFLLIGQGTSLDGDTCRVQGSFLINEVEHSAIEFEANCSGTGEQVFTFSFKGMNAQ